MSKVLKLWTTMSLFQVVILCLYFVLGGSMFTSQQTSLTWNTWQWDANRLMGKMLPPESWNDLDVS